MEQEGGVGSGKAVSLQCTETKEIGKAYIGQG